MRCTRKTRQEVYKQNDILTLLRNLLCPLDGHIGHLDMTDRGLIEG